jgi:hypothetical protein
MPSTFAPLQAGILTRKEGTILLTSPDLAATNEALRPYGERLPTPQVSKCRAPCPPRPRLIIFRARQEGRILRKAMFDLQG